MTLVLAARRQSGYALGRAAGGLSWLLRDDFLTDLPAGSVNGTAAEPGPGTRTVVDTNGVIKIASGVLFFDGTVAADDRFVLSGITRAAGRMMLTQVTSSLPGGNAHRLGLSNNGSSGTDGNPGIAGNGATTVYIKENSSAVETREVGGVPQHFCFILRSVGAMWFARVSGNWVLLRVGEIGNTGTMYPKLLVSAASGASEQISFMRVPDALWLPTPLASDGFGSTFGTTDGLGHAEGIAGGIGAGGSGVAWSNVGSTWSVSGGKAINTPSVDGDLVVDGDMEAVGVANWATVGLPTTVDKSGTQKHGGSQSLRIVSSGADQGVTQTIAASVGTFYKVSAWLYGTGSAGLNLKSSLMTGASAIVGFSRSASWVRVSGSALCINANPTVGIESRDGGSYTSYADDVKFEALALSEVLSVSDLSSHNVLLSGSLVSNATRLQGVALSWDSSTNPQNGVFFIPFSTTWTNNIVPNRLCIYKYVAGIMTLVGGATWVFSYSAGARLVVAKNGTEYRVYYNNALIVAVTISDASIVNNTLHGMFSTDASNTLDDFTCYATGTGGEYATLDQYIQP